MSLGIVPKLQSAVLALPLPSGIRNILAHPAGPFTSTLAALNLPSLLLGSNIQVDDNDI